MSTHEDDIPFAGEYLDFAEMSRDELQSKLFELLTLVETSRELLRAQDEEDVARRVLLSVIGVLGASSASVLLRDAPEFTFRLRERLGLEIEEVLEIHLEPELARVFVEGEISGPFRADEVLAPGTAATLLQSHASELARLDADVVCPLVGRSGLVGFLILGRRLLAEGYTARDLDLFASLAELYVLALERAPRPGAAARPHPERAGSTPPGLVQTPVPRATALEPNPATAELRRQYPPLRKILGESEIMLQLFRDLAEFADSRATILIQGESGTGKELIAKAIHEISRRRSGPLEIVDCSSIPKELIESELFGHVRGAFTGAVRDRRGAFDLAHNGTIFLDEIGEMTLSSQTRLLRVLQEGKFRPVGGEKTHSVDVRVIAATNVDLRQAVREGAFRKDLFFRIQVFPVRLPPLRERDGDVEFLTRAFLKRFYADFGRGEPTIAREVIERLRAYGFPGNVRELQNITEALAIRSRAEGAVRLEHLEDIFRSMHIQTDLAEPEMAGEAHTVAPSSSGPPAGSSSTQPVARSSRMGSSGTELDRQGELVARAWRAASFNLLEASRQLRARRLEGQHVSLVDRVQMSHYLDGEILRAFLEEGSVAGALERLAGAHPMRHRANKRIHRTIDQFCAAAEAGNAMAAFPRLPQEYLEVVRRLRDRGTEWMRARLSARA